MIQKISAGRKRPSAGGPGRIVVAGHICLDIIPPFPAEAHLNASAGTSGLVPAEARLGAAIFKPGGLVQVGPALRAAGGVVSNTGLALQRLGFEPRLVGRVGDDWIGREILAILRSHGPRFAADMRIVRGEQSSYTIVLSPPGVDRIFLHCPGANDSFSAADVAPDRFGEARLFHFGYPPVMRRMYSDTGRELALLFRRLRSRGLVTSLDMAGIDASSEAGRVDWDALLRNVLPFVDLFLPSIDEMVQMLAPELVGKPGDQPDRDDPSGLVDGPLLSALADRLLGYGAAVVGLKLGTQGFYLRTTADCARWAGLAGAIPIRPDAWLDRELLAPSFRVRVAGTTGAGDCAIAGFLAGVLRGLGPEDTLRSAVGAGASCVERPDAVSGVPSWSALWKRLNAGWRRHPIDLPLPGWRWDKSLRLWRGLYDGRRTEK